MTLYVSWGGSGYTEALRSAARQSQETGTELVYLAVVDDNTFGDVDGATMEMLIEELDFLLRTQMVGVRRQIGAPDLPASVVIKRGTVGAAIAEAAAALGATSALVGGPLPISADADPDQVLAALRSESGVALTLI